MRFKSIAIMSPGVMGNGFGWALKSHGHDIVTCLAGRGDATRARAADTGFRDVPDLDTLVAEADLVISILPPEAAPQLADDIAAAMKSTGKAPVYAECNAVSPDTSRAMARRIEAAGAVYIDGGTIGFAPGKSDVPVRIFVSGPEAELMRELDGTGIDIRVCGEAVGDASAIKMCYAGVTKGTNTLHTAALMAAESLGVRETLEQEFEYSLGPVYQRMKANVPRLPLDAARWIGEMEEIAKTFAAAGVTPLFHDGAREIFQLLATTSIAGETRETVDPNRGLREVLEIYVDRLRAREAAE
jgi:3-hydroxyisobutyrate dehydrogenase-like beta-hydroxyacid dehydrogenase